jgi:hypothetical protein
MALISTAAMAVGSPPSGMFDWHCSDGVIGSNTPAPIVTAYDDTTVTSVDFKLDGQELGLITVAATTSSDGHTKSFQAAPWNSSLLVQTMHQLKALITDSDGNTSWAVNDCPTPTPFFTFDASFTPPTINITAPAEGEQTAATSLNVSGTASTNLSRIIYVTVNGQKATIPPGSATFSTTISFPSGQSLLVIKVVATDYGGNQSSAQVAVHRPQSSSTPSSTPSPTPSPTSTITLSPTVSATPTQTRSPSPKARPSNYLAAAQTTSGIAAVALLGLLFMFRHRLLKRVAQSKHNKK